MIKLLSNTIKFFDKDELEIRLTFRELATHYQITFEDNGHVISQQNLSKIFELFERENEDFEIDGYGLGLATVKRLVSKMGGEIFASSPSGRGATFDFTLEKPLT